MTWKEMIALLKNSNSAEEIDGRRDEIAYWIPQIRIMFEYDQNNNYHQYDLWMHSVHTVLGIPKEVKDDMLYMAALLHDIGKPRSRCKGHKEDDKWSHYYGHPEISEEIVRKQVIQHLNNMGVHISVKDIRRLLYYVRYHDDRVSLKLKHLKRHLEVVDLDTFKKLMMLQVADAKAHILHPLIQQRIDICTTWVNGHAEQKMIALEEKEATAKK